MPFLGGSQREWIETVGFLNDRYRCITVDLPGFGAAAAVPGYSVSEMADAVLELLSSLRLSRYVLIGHSMAGKVLAVATRRLVDAAASLQPPASLVLVAPSPPGPEPMSDAKRAEMLKSLGNQGRTLRTRYLESDRPAAEQFVRDNVAKPIPDAIFQRTVDDVLEMNPAAWTAWLESGSKEDYGQFLGVLDLPTLIVAGSDDEALGPAAQREHTLPHFRHAQLAEVKCSHLIPLERSGELASIVSKFLEQTFPGADSES